jgi:DNA polymerase-3 subunit gamma/tau
MFALLSKDFTKKESDEAIVVELKNCSAFDKKRVESKRDELATICQNLLGKSLTINLISGSPDKEAKETIKKKKQDNKNRQAAYNHPMVVEAKKIFNGEIIN